jgi:hypothetical protein
MWSFGEDEVPMFREDRSRATAQALGLTAVSVLFLGWAVMTFGPPLVRYLRMRRM